MSKEQGEFLKAELHVKGWSQVRLAKHLGVCKQTVSGVVSNNRRSRRVEQAIADILGRTVEEVFPDRYSPKDLPNRQEEETDHEL